MAKSLKRYLRLLLWVWLISGVALGTLAAMNPDVKEWLVATAEEHRG